MGRKKLILLIFAFFASMSLAAFSQDGTDFHLLKKYGIKSDGGWDYLTVDTDKKNVYVSHGNQVNIINTETGDSVGVIKNTSGVHGIVLVKDLNKGYTTNGRDNSCTVFDLKSNQEITKITTGTNPDAVLYDDFSKKVFVFNGKSEDATVIDPTIDKVVSTISLGGKPEAGVSNGNGLIFVNLETTNEVGVIDANSYEVKIKYKINQGDEPSGLAIDRLADRLFIGCGGNQTMVMMDASSGNNIAHFPIGNCDGVTFDPIYKMIYSSNGEGTISVIKEINPNKFELVKNIITEKGARTIAIDLGTHHLFTSTALSEAAQSTLENPHPRPKIVSGTFHVLEIGE